MGHDPQLLRLFLDPLQQEQAALVASLPHHSFERFEPFACFLGIAVIYRRGRGVRQMMGRIEGAHLRATSPPGSLADGKTRPLKS
jgi:hypothetical protein